MKSSNRNTPSIVSTTNRPLDKYVQRFIDKLEEHPITGCLLYSGGCASNNYGIYSVRGKSVLAHRYAYESFYGPCPADKVVGHSSQCVSRTCCNPLHLSAITSKENSQQRVVDGTMDVPRRKYVTATAAEIQDIRARHAKGESMYSIGKLYSRAPGYVASVVRGDLHSPTKPPAKKGPKPTVKVSVKFQEVA